MKRHVILSLITCTLVSFTTHSMERLPSKHFTNQKWEDERCQKKTTRVEKEEEPIIGTAPDIKDAYWAAKRTGRQGQGNVNARRQLFQ